MLPKLVVVHASALESELDGDADGDTESKAQVICRLHTNPPCESLAHCAHEGTQLVHPAASSSVEDSSHGASLLARPTDWYQV